MKKIILGVAATALPFLTVTLFAQQTWDAKKNPTVDSITSKYEGKLLPQRPPLLLSDIFPVIGQYKPGPNSDNSTPKISLDGENKGVIIIEGLPQGTFKAMLRKSPATYKIPAQKTAEGKEMAEGVLVYDKENNVLNICVGCTYNSVDPLTAFTVQEPVAEPVVKHGKKIKPIEKIKSWFYTGTRSLETNATAVIEK